MSEEQRRGIARTHTHTHSLSLSLSLSIIAVKAHLKLQKTSRDNCRVHNVTALCECVCMCANLHACCVCCSQRRCSCAQVLSTQCMRARCTCTACVQPVHALVFKAYHRAHLHTRLLLFVLSSSTILPRERGANLGEYTQATDKFVHLVKIVFSHNTHWLNRDHLTDSITAYTPCPSILFIFYL